jgi:hypothetical protein
MMFIDLPVGCWYLDQNTWNAIPVSGQKISLNNQVTEHWIVEQSKSNKIETELGEWLNRNKWCELKQLARRWITTDKQQQINWQRIWLKTDALNINNSEGWMVTVLYLRGLNILWLQNWQLQPYVPRCLLWGIRCHAVSFFAFPAGLLKNNRTPQQICCFIPTTPVQYQSS